MTLLQMRQTHGTHSIHGHAMTVTLHDLEQAVADAAILRPDLTASLAGIVQPADFADQWLAQVFDAACSIAGEGGGYELVNAVLVGQGVHTGDADICRLYELRGHDVRLPTSEAEVYAAVVADTARRRAIAVTIAAAATSLQAGSDITGILDRLRSGVAAT